MRNTHSRTRSSLLPSAWRLCSNCRTVCAAFNTDWLANNSSTWSLSFSSSCSTHLSSSFIGITIQEELWTRCFYFSKRAKSFMPEHSNSILRIWISLKTPNTYLRLPISLTLGLRSSPLRSTLSLRWSSCWSLTPRFRQNCLWLVCARYWPKRKIQKHKIFHEQSSMLLSPRW